MAFSPIGSLDLGKYLQIAFTKGAMAQINKSQKEWEMVARMRDPNPNGRERRFLFINSLGYAAIQSRNPGTAGDFPAAQKAQIAEYTALYKEINATIEIEQNLWAQAQKDPVKYAEPLAKEFELKAVGARRILGMYLFGDGTGVIGQAGAAGVDTTGAGGSVAVTLSAADSARGHIRWFQIGDLLLNKNPDGSADNPTVTGTFYAWRIKSISGLQNLAVLEATDVNGNVLPLTASSIDLGDVFYRVGQQTFPDLTAAGLTNGTLDYNTISEVPAGLESLVSADGRNIHGILMSGNAAATIVDYNGDTLDVDALQVGLDEVDMRVGKGEFRYQQACMSPEARRVLIASRETDRRFTSITDTERGGKGFGYVHDEDTVKYVATEFCPKTRIYVLPEGSVEGNKVITYFGTDFEAVDFGNGNQKMSLKPSSNGGFSRNYVSYVMQRGAFVNHRPAATLQIRNFSLS